jgi:hypothetical protein
VVNLILVSVPRPSYWSGVPLAYTNLGKEGAKPESERLDILQPEVAIWGAIPK